MNRRFRGRFLAPLAVSLLVPGGPAAAPSALAQAPATVRLDVLISGIEGPHLANVQALTGIARAARSGEVRPGHVYRLYDRAPEEIERALVPFGFYRVTVTSALQSDSPPWQARFEVDPGPPLFVDRLDVRVTGEAEDDSVFQAALANLPLAEGDTLNHPAYERAKTSIELLAADRGYLDAAWDSAFIRVDLEEYRSEIVLHMSTGPRFRFGEVSIDQEWVDMDILEPMMDFRAGDYFHSAPLRALQNDLVGTTYFANVEIVPR